MIDGRRKVVIASQKLNFEQEVDIIFSAFNQEHHYIEIDLRFDVENAFETEEPTCSQVGLRMRTFMPYLYDSEYPGVFYQLTPGEETILNAGMLVKMGSLTFIVERFNTGICSKVGNRYRMEDAYAILHDLGLDINLKSSFYAVIDGHGGDWCSKMLRKELVPFLIKTLKAKLKLLGEDAANGRLSEIMHQVFYRMYKLIDKEFFDRSKEAAK